MKTNDVLQLSQKTLYPIYGTKNDEKITAMVSVKAGEVERASREPVDIVCCIDVSGSMDGEPLNLVKKTLHFMLNELNETDRLGLVVFSTQATTLLPLSYMDASLKKKVRGIIDGMKADALTNISEGLEHAIKCASGASSGNAREARSIRSILLLTDGDTNKGITSTEGIISNSQMFMKETSKCSINCFGFGKAHNADMLTSIARDFQGTYALIERQSDISESFATCLGGLFSCVATEGKIRVTALPGYTIKTVYSGFPSVENVAKMDYTISFDDVQEEESRDFVFQILGSEVQPADSHAILKVELTYKNIVAKDKPNEQRAMVVFTNRQVEVPKDQVPDLQVGEHLTRLKSNRLIEKAKELTKQGNTVEAKNLFSNAIREISEAPWAEECEYVKTNLACLNMAVDDSQLFDCRTNDVQSYQSRQRCTAGERDKRFITKAKKSIIARFK